MTGLRHAYAAQVAHGMSWPKRWVVYVLAWVLGPLSAFLVLSCQAHPLSPPPDADAAPAVVQAPDGALLPPCEAACEVLTAVGCQALVGDCVRSLSHVDGTPGSVLEPNGRTLTCLDIAAARTKADVQALGICRGQ